MDDQKKGGKRTLLKTQTKATDGDRLIRLPEVQKLIPVGKSTWWEGVKSGRFPKPVKLGPRVTCWRLADILTLVKEGANG